ncbi:hypothetical protein QBC40DRAFT_23980 [Triangularia verruculosa]|uniref:Uncharacterized protein n=1 Tax=Triangularia verruculosa TaxID=2587418 RepID=A0AAN7AYQ7_9PEZI|nr:hypothetical protein QBC40DRAFT_23980 [Triangularia verruculosa]
MRMPLQRTTATCPGIPRSSAISFSLAPFPPWAPLGVSLSRLFLRLQQNHCRSLSRNNQSRSFQHTPFDSRFSIFHQHQRRRGPRRDTPPCEDHLDPPVRDEGDARSPVARPPKQGDEKPPSIPRTTSYPIPPDRDHSFTTPLRFDFLSIFHRPLASQRPFLKRFCELVADNPTRKNKKHNRSEEKDRASRRRPSLKWTAQSPE